MRRLRPQGLAKADAKLMCGECGTVMECNAVEED